MNDKILTPQHDDNEQNVEISAHLIQKLQTATEIDTLWLVLLNEVKLGAAIKEAHLVYRAGLLMEKLDYFGAQIIAKPLNGFPLANGHHDFEVTITPQEVSIFKQENGQIIQMEILLDPSICPSQEHLNAISTLVPIFTNQLFQLLQIKNYEFNAIKDDITLAYNQNYLKAFMHNEIERAKRYATIFPWFF